MITLDYNPNSRKTLYIIRGIPGSGKTTFAKKLVRLNFLICEADKYFIDKETGKYKFDASKLGEAHQWCQNLVKKYMEDGLHNEEFYREIVVSNTFTQEWEMQPYFDLAKTYNYDVFSIIVENRHGGKNIHGVPEEKIQLMKDRFQIKL